MLFHTTFRHKIGYTPDDQRLVLKLWKDWTPPEGFEIQSFHMAPDGRGFLLVEAEDAATVFESTALWSAVLIDYDIVPVVDVDQAVQILSAATEKR